MNRLENFINDHRKEFDDMSPSEKVWQQVEIAVTKKTGKRFFFRPAIRWSAAAAVLIIAASALLFTVGKKENVERTLAEKNTDTARANPISLAPEAAPEMNQFAKLIAGKQEELKLLAVEQPQLYQTFSKDFSQLDSSYNNLKNKLSVTPNRQLLIEAMIQNLELQLNVLNQQLNIINQIKQSKKSSHEKNKSYT